MPALVAANLTPAVTETVIRGTKRVNYGTLAFGDGVLTYPTGGIPLPAFSVFGFQRQMDTLEFLGVNGLTADYKLGWDKTNAKLQLFGDRAAAALGLPLSESAATEAPAARTYTWRAEGW